jgi:amino acid permease
MLQYIMVNMQYFYVLVVFSLSSIFSFGQGKLVVVGGGGESEGGWSDAPYTWGINEANNKRVAVISGFLIILNH